METSFEETMNKVLIKWENQLLEYQQQIMFLQDEHRSNDDADERRNIFTDLNTTISKKMIIQEMVDDLKSVLGR